MITAYMSDFVGNKNLQQAFHVAILTVPLHDFDMVSYSGIFYVVNMMWCNTEFRLLKKSSWHYRCNNGLGTR